MRKEIFYRGVKIFIPENLSEQEEDTFIRSAKSSVGRWRRPNRKPRRRRNV
tara:strand:- start:485 stop:637 length:153 start_codon:yes stop_codon:yes gene_type:complete